MERLQIDNPLFSAFFEAVAVDDYLGHMSRADIAYLVQKPWKYTEEFNLWKAEVEQQLSINS